MPTKRTNQWWGAPENFSERKNVRKISWLELFYDLVYVAVIGQLTYQVAANPTWETLGFSFLLFCLIFWSWVNGSQYYDLHGSDSIRTRLLTFWQMLAVAAVAITIGDAFRDHQRDFDLTFAVLQILITYLWWSVGFYDPSHRVFSKFYTFNYVAAFILLIASLFISHTLTTEIWVLVLLLDLTPPLTGARTIVRELKKRGEVFTASATIVERLGNFTIIVLAESILGTVTGISEGHERTPAAWLAFMLSILISFLLWSIYFDMTSDQETKKGYKYLQWLIFLHFPLLAAMSAIGASMKVILSHVQTELPLEMQWMFCISLSIILLMIVGITRIMKQEEEERSYVQPVSRLLIVISAGVLVIPVFGDQLTSLSFLSVISLSLLIPVIIGIRFWVKYKYFRQA